MAKLPTPVTGIGRIHGELSHSATTTPLSITVKTSLFTSHSTRKSVQRFFLLLQIESRRNETLQLVKIADWRHMRSIPVLLKKLRVANILEIFSFSGRNEQLTATRKHFRPFAKHTCFGGRHQMLLGRGGPQVNKFEQV